jgi:hypothetical protein
VAGHFLEGSPGDGLGLTVAGGYVPAEAAVLAGGADEFVESEKGFAEAAAGYEETETAFT